MNVDDVESALIDLCIACETESESQPQRKKTPRAKSD